MLKKYENIQTYKNYAASLDGIDEVQDLIYGIGFKVFNFLNINFFTVQNLFSSNFRIVIL